MLESKVDGLACRFDMALRAEKVDALVTERLQRMQKAAHVSGFRRGKAPLHVIRIHHGTKIRSSIIDRMAVDAARNLIAEKRLKVVGRPAIKMMDAGRKVRNQFRFTLTLEIFPDVCLKTIDKFEIERLIVSADEIWNENSASEQSSPELSDKAIEARVSVLSRQHLKRQVLDRLTRDYDFSVPSEMVMREHERIMQSYSLAVDDKISSDLDAELRTIAVRRVRLALVLTEIGRQQQLGIPRQEVERLVEAQAERDSDHGAKIVDFYLEHPTALAELQSTLFEDRIVDHILGRAVITDREVTVRELIAASDSL